MFVTVKVRAHNGQESLFKMRRDTPLYKLMNAFCRRHGLQRASIRFLYDGVRLDDLDTPETLGIENEDTIDAMLFQVGGSACQRSLRVHVHNEQGNAPRAHSVNTLSELICSEAAPAEPTLLMRGTFVMPGGARLDTSISADWMLHEESRSGLNRCTTRE